MSAQEALDFDGETYSKDLDGKRLSPQLAIVLGELCKGWQTLPALAATASRVLRRSVSETSVSARVRDLRKLKFGGHNIERRRRARGGTWEYRVSVEPAPAKGPSKVDQFRSLLWDLADSLDHHAPLSRPKAERWADEIRKRVKSIDGGSC